MFLVRRVAQAMAKDFNAEVAEVSQGAWRLSRLARCQLFRGELVLDLFGDLGGGFEDAGEVLEMCIRDSSLAAPPRRHW